MPTLAEVLSDLTRNPLSWFLGIAGTVNTVQCTMTVVIGGESVTDIPYLASVAPVPGCEVHVLSGSPGLLVIGSADKRTSVAGVVTVPATAPPTPILPPTPLVRTVRASASDSYLRMPRGLAYWAGAPTLLGALNDAATGLWFYPPDQLTALAARTLMSLTVALTRQAETIGLPVGDRLQPILRLHATPDTSAGVLWNQVFDVWLGPGLLVGERRVISLPVGWATEMVQGRASGVALVAGSRSGALGPMQLSGVEADDPGSGELTIEYL